MTMQAESLEILEKANVPGAQARAIVQAIEIEIAGAKDSVATKHDVLLLREETKELGRELRQEMKELRHGLELKIEGLRTEVARSVSGVSRQMYTAMLGQMAVLLGVAYFFVTHIVH